MPQEMTLGVPRRLASVPLPLAGESLHSWVEHVAVTYEIGRKQTMSLLGLETGSNPGRSLGYFTAQLDASQAANVSSASGLTLDEVFAMTLSPLHVDDKGHRILDRWIHVDGRNSFRSTRELAGVCPKCLAETDNRWPLRWCRPWSVLCLKHSCYLIRECTTCGAAIQPWRFRNTSPGLCAGPAPVGSSLRRPSAAEYVAPSWCGKPLKELPIRLTRDCLLLEIQARLDGWPLADGPGQEQERSAENDFKVLLKLASRHADLSHLAGADRIVRNDFPSRARHRKYFNSSRGLEMAGLVRIAGQLAAHRDMDEAARWLLWDEEADSPRQYPDYPWNDNDIWSFLLASERLYPILRLSLGSGDYGRLARRRTM
ncbi:TniQ family protein [Kitasatospora cheerisanensis]|uniref:TniQ family protein n=1 Tax=Kitasatospora cheerisanensis TaxID=81942 RepID=UPI0012EE691C|nr:TniQ family protein [Kitasatospora cheerisanensis]